MILFQIYFTLILIIGTSSEDIRSKVTPCGASCLYHWRPRVCYCWTEQCAKCITSIGEVNSTSINSSEKLKTVAIPKPKLLCEESTRSSAMISIDWPLVWDNVTLDIYDYVIQDKHVSFVCLIEIRDRQMEILTHRWNFVNQAMFVARAKGFEISHLRFNHEYQIRITGLSLTGLPNITVYSDWITTLPRNEKLHLHPPTDIAVHGTIPTTPASEVAALVSWTVPPEHSCQYIIYIYPNNTKLSSLDCSFMNFLHPTKIRCYVVDLSATFFPVRLPSLRYDTNYTFSIVTTNHNRSVKSSIASTWFFTKTCLEYHNNSYIDCAPHAPKIRYLRYLPPDHIQIQWSPPILASESNPILTYRISVIQQLVKVLGKINTKALNISHAFFPNQTSAIFSNLDTGNTYDVEIIAISRGGTSEISSKSITLPAANARYSHSVDSSSSSSSITWQLSPLVVAVVCLSLLLMLTTSIMCYMLWKKFKRLNNNPHERLRDSDQDSSIL